MPDGDARTFGEMSAEEKHGVDWAAGRGLSHRARAFLKLAEASLADDEAGGEASPGFGVYVHWPFCLAKCPYCDFNSHVRHHAVDEARFARAFAREIAATAQRIGPRTVNSIFLGGGTPSLMEPATVRRCSTRSPSTGRSRRRRDHPRGQSHLRRGRRAFAATAPPASTASRSACRR